MPAPETTRRLILAGAAIAAAGGVLVWKSLARRAAVDPAGPGGMRVATELNDAEPVPEFSLIGPAGPLTRNDLLGRPTVLFFGYTQCPDVCPTTLSMLAEAFRQLQPAEQPRVLFISVDPQRDTLELLKAYVPNFNPAFGFATGPDEALAPLVKHFGVMYQRHEKSANGFYTVDHTASLFLLDGKARLKAVFAAPHAAATFVPEYRRLTR